MRRTTLAIALVTVVVVAAAAVGLRALWQDFAVTADDGCQFAGYTTSTDQAATAATMVAVVTRRGLPERAAVLVLAAGLQESKLTNIPAGDGDRDSVGVLQQRPSQGWGGGDPKKLANVSLATGFFLDRMVKVSAWQTRPLATVIQTVQISADGSAYAGHEPEAQAIADALTGKAPRAITCTFAKAHQPPAAATMAHRLAAELPVNAPTVTGRSISVAGAGWVTAAWFVANGERGDIATVNYAGWRWTRGHGWRTATGVPGSAVVATQAS